MKQVKILVVAMMGALALVQSANAAKAGQSAQQSPTMTFDSISKVTASDLADFKANPKSLLNSNPIGGLQLVAMVKSLSLTDPNTVASLIDLIGSANPLQLAAIGSGLGQAARILKNSSNESDRKAAETIQSLVDGAKNDSLQTAFKSSLTGRPDASGTPNNGKDSSRSSTGPVGGGVGGVVNTSGTGNGVHNTSTTNTPAATSMATVNTVETIPFSGTSVTCTSSVSPTHVC